MANSKEIFSKNVKYLLKKNDLSRETVARVLGVKYTTFCDWVKGRSYPKMDYISQLANYLMVTTSALTDENPDYDKSEHDAKLVQTSVNSYDVYAHNQKGDMFLLSTEPVTFDLCNEILEDKNENGILPTKYQFIGLRLNDDSMEPKYFAGDKIIVAWTGYTTDSDYLIENLKTEDIFFRTIKIEDDSVTMYVLNPVNQKRITTKYFKKDEFFSKYRLFGKVKKLERIYKGY